MVVEMLGMPEWVMHWLSPKFEMKKVIEMQ